MLGCKCKRLYRACAALGAHRAYAHESRIACACFLLTQQKGSAVLAALGPLGVRARVHAYNMLLHCTPVHSLFCCVCIDCGVWLWQRRLHIFRRHSLFAGCVHHHQRAALCHVVHRCDVVVVVAYVCLCEHRSR